MKSSQFSARLDPRITGKSTALSENCNCGIITRFSTVWTKTSKNCTCGISSVFCIVQTMKPVV